MRIAQRISFVGPFIALLSAIPVSAQYYTYSQTISFPPVGDKTLGSPPFSIGASASSSLPVTLRSNSSNVCTLSGNTVTLVSTGTCSITATQGGDSYWSAAPPVTQSFNVLGAAKSPQSITFGGLTDQTMGAMPLQLSASASSGLAVTYSSNTPGVCTVSGNMVSLLGTGTCSITASQAGNAAYNAAAPVTQTFAVKTTAPQPQTINFSTIPSHTFGDQPFTLSASGGASGNPVTFSVSSGPASISGQTLTILGAGTVTVVASEAGNSSYQAATASQTFAVNKGTQTLTFSPLGSHGGADGPISLQATASSGLPVVFSVVSGPATLTGATLTLAGVGSVTVQASQAGSDNYSPASAVTQSFTVSLSAPLVSLIQNAASYSSGMVAPGSYASLFGASFDAQSSTKGPVTAKVTVKDSTGVETPATMVYSDFRQINFLVPGGLAAGQATLTVSNSAGASKPYPIMLGTVAPGLFTADFSGQGAVAAQALVVAADGTRSFAPAAQCTGTPATCTTVAIPLAPGTQVFLVLYGTGIKGRSSLNAVSVVMGGAAGSVTYAGVQGDFPGLDQIDVQVPASLAGMGEVDLKLTVDTLAANTVRVRF
jgi:uncharacterized protein (TIGR03437 family)